jgi:membrane-bound inhibitor of C-type lysozyme
MAIKTRETTATGVTNKGSPLTNAELDNNFVELQQGKLTINASLNDLTDVNLSTAATDGQVLVFDNSTSKFIPGASGSGLDGGFANSTYLTAQNVNGGGA